MARRPTLHRGGPSGLPISIGATPAEKRRETLGRLAALKGEAGPERAKYVQAGWDAVKRKGVTVREAWFLMRETKDKAQAQYLQSLLAQRMPRVEYEEDWPVWSWYDL